MLHSEQLQVDGGASGKVQAVQLVSSTASTAPHLAGLAHMDQILDVCNSSELVLSEPYVACVPASLALHSCVTGRSLSGSC